ncbi:SMC5-like protein [Immersiella caudata]|uniref:Structural maintenance of chromosomes protein 5 n=1 Tax=Immersiella caudata TaxID=314043 RepID=A0AA39XGJ8_9PEZI|nr:SMC5-like protein [Immersiella caudata]
MLIRNHHGTGSRSSNDGAKLLSSCPNLDNDVFSSLSLRGGDGSSGAESDVKHELSDDEPQRTRHRRGARGGALARPTNGTSPDDFQPGAIVRVKLTNFVTYEKAEFLLGPHLNMVIGPNGTGKSSLVCAICLGLGYPSSVLGRASAFGDFVKHGKDEAEIEMELQRKPRDRENYVVGLTIIRESNSRRFTLNGSSVPVKEIQRLMKELRIQIDNLCQFLPQDKVAEFAGLTPVELLEKTLHAAAAPEMIEWQRELKEDFAAQKEAERNAEQTREQLRKMEARQQVLQADVEKIQERKVVQQTIEKLEAIHLVLQYSEARAAYTAVKRRQKEAMLEQKCLEESSQPSLLAVNRKQKYEARIKSAVQAREAALKAAEIAASRALAVVDGAESKSHELQASHEAELKNLNSKKQELGKIRRKVTEFEAQLKQAPKAFDAADWNRRIREQEHLEREKGNDAADIDRELQRVKTLGITKKNEMQAVERKIRELDSKEGQILNRVQQKSPEVAKGWEWLKDHQDEFEKPVFGPPVLSCTVKNPAYSDLVQSTLAPGDMLCFTAQTKDDHKKLSAKFYNDLNISVTIRTCVKPLRSYQPPVPRDHLSRLGFDGYVLDYLEGPGPVLAMLCSEKKIHASAVSLKDITSDQHEQVIQEEKINQFACGDRACRITRRREYGPSGVTTRIDRVKSGQWWTDQPPDQSYKRELQQKHTAISNEVQDLMAEYKLQRANQEALQRDKKEIGNKVMLLREQKSELQVEFNRHQSLPDKIATATVAAQKVEQELQDCKLRLLEIQQKKGQVILDKAQAVLLHQKTLGAIRSAHHALLEARLLLVEAQSDVAHLKDNNSEIATKLNDGREALAAIKAEYAQRKDEAMGFYERVASLPEGQAQRVVDESRDRTAESIFQEMSAERAKLEVIQANNPQALGEYETWGRRIDRHRTEHQNHETQLAELTRKIATLRAQWEPRVDELVEKINEAFSYNFEQISCAGEVGVHKDEDFDKWAIEIRVKFRQGETLQRLDQHRQSGGERAVSTIFYLMSLQSMAQAPFRVVDEINQGMDPRNERMVHERMVEIACREHTSQYFLITPKLLSGLRYDERMRVHTIVSGEFVEETATEKMNFGRFAGIRRQVMRRVQAH